MKKKEKKNTFLKKRHKKMRVFLRERKKIEFFLRERKKSDIFFLWGLDYCAQASFCRIQSEFVTVCLLFLTIYLRQGEEK